jgi:hypothetical protein
LFSSADLYCGGNYTDTEGELLLPPLTGPFSHSRQCVYLISQPQGEQIVINFTHVELESQRGCSHTFIEVTFLFSYPWGTLITIFMFCGVVVFKWLSSQVHLDHQRACQKCLPLLSITAYAEGGKSKQRVKEQEFSEDLKESV